MIGKSDKNMSSDGGSYYVYASSDGGTTWIPIESDADGRPLNKLVNITGDEVNPATEDKQDDVITELQVLNSLVPDAYDYIALTYVAAGDGAGEVETVTYKTGGSGGTTVATLTLAYNGDNNLISVTKS